MLKLSQRCLYSTVQPVGTYKTNKQILHCSGHSVIYILAKVFWCQISDNFQHFLTCLCNNCQSIQCVVKTVTQQRSQAPYVHMTQQHSTVAYHKWLYLSCMRQPWHTRCCPHAVGAFEATFLWCINLWRILPVTAVPSKTKCRPKKVQVEAFDFYTWRIIQTAESFLYIRKHTGCLRSRRFTINCPKTYSNKQ